ncbi:MAG: hypothetical protein DWQ09_01480 [Proteobacteria bacterium]|nr:MAG: hypothetical protein DWQ09_01480 [Pseudomonadota bacterium]
MKNIANQLAESVVRNQKAFHGDGLQMILVCANRICAVTYAEHAQIEMDQMKFFMSWFAVFRMQ